GTYRPTGRIVAFGQAGDDLIRLDRKRFRGRETTVAVGAVLDGGDGDDELSAEGNSAANVLLGAAGDDVLRGGRGNDFLSGGDGRDLLVGGWGRDTLKGGKGDDVLIGGVYTHSEVLSAIDSLLAAWGSSLSYEERVAELRRGGPDGRFPLDPLTVLDDGA